MDWKNLYEYASLVGEVKPDSKDNNLFRYCGEYYDKETEEIYLRARYYQPEMGRFLTRDTYTGEEDEPESLHLYAHCGNDGVNSVNPSGHDAVFLHYGYAVGSSDTGGRKRGFSFGHSGLLVENKYGGWYYFYWGKAGGKYVRISINSDILDKPNDETINKVEEATKKIYSEMITGYIKGNFQKTHKNLLVYKDKDNYNLITRNCVQASVRNLLLGKFKRPSKKLGKELRKLKNGVVPRNTFDTLRFFIINKASKKQKKYFYERK